MRMVASMLRMLLVAVCMKMETMMERRTMIRISMLMMIMMMLMRKNVKDIRHMWHVRYILDARHMHD